MKKVYPSKKAKRKAEAKERKNKREAERKRQQRIDTTTDIEELAMLMGVRLN